MEEEAEGEKEVVVEEVGAEKAEVAMAEVAKAEVEVGGKGEAEVAKEELVLDTCRTTSQHVP